MTIDADTIAADTYSIVREHIKLTTTSELRIEDELFGAGLDSMALITIIVALEQRFGFQFAMEDLDLEKFNTIQAIAGIVRAKLQC